MKVGLLECDHVAERFRPIAGDYREMFAALFKRYAPQLCLEYFDVCRGELPHALDACDAYLHQDQVQRLPENGVLLGQSEHCSVAMLRIGDAMLGIQGHPEFMPSYVEALLLDRIERVGANRVQTARASLRQATDEGVVTRWIAEFLGAEKVVQ